MKPGDDMAKVIGADDHVVEFEITPNRPDCLSVIGLAREASATFGRPLKLHTPEVKGCGGSIAELVDIDIEDGDLCPRYTARMVKNVKIQPSPAWMRERLRNSGVRPINNIVDITNYVMLEYGQPMHAFDLRYLVGNTVNVRNAKAGETITTLDGETRELTENMLVIADTDIRIDSVIVGLEAKLAEMELGALFGLWVQSMFVGFTMWALAICIFIITYGRMIEIYLVTSVAPIPMATMVNREWGQMGQNYLRSLLALGFQAFLIIVCVAIYAVLVQNIALEDDIIMAIWSCVGYTVLLCFTLFKTGSLAKSVFQAH